MNKIGLVLGVTAVTALVGCLDPKYKQKKTVVTTVNEPQPQVEVAPVEEVATPAPIIVETAPVTPAPVVTQPVVQAPVAAPETTTYIVQRGDTLAKISKRYNITQAAIKRANPSIKNDVVRLGQKLVLPGKVDVGEQKVPEGAFAKPAAQAKAAHVAYTGATVEYVVKSGDMLGTIARKHGCTVRQLQELNGLSTDVVRAGQKLKVPAAKAVPAAEVKKVEKPEAKESAKPVEAKKEVEAAAPVKEAEKPVEEVKVEEPAEVKETAPAAAPAKSDDYISYTVQAGEDITSVSIQTYVSPTEIRQLNNLSDDEQLKPGMVLKLPASSLQ